MTASHERRSSPAASYVPRMGDVVFKLLCQTAAAIVLLVVIGLVAVLAVESWPFWQKMGGAALTGSEWNAGREQFGVWALVWGTLVTSAIAMAIAVPLGVGAAAFLSEIAS